MNKCLVLLFSLLSFISISCITINSIAHSSTSLLQDNVKNLKIFSEHIFDHGFYTGCKVKIYKKVSFWKFIGTISDCPAQPYITLGDTEFHAADLFKDDK